MRFVRIVFVVCIVVILGIGLSIRSQQAPAEEQRGSGYGRLSAGYR